MKDELSIGAWNKLPHYSVVGRPTDFYVYINKGQEYGFYIKGEQGASGWIVGKEAFKLHNKLSQLLKKDKQEFINLVVQLHNDYPR